MYKIIDKHLQM